MFKEIVVLYFLRVFRTGTQSLCYLSLSNKHGVCIFWVWNSFFFAFGNSGIKTVGNEDRGKLTLRSFLIKSLASTPTYCGRANLPFKIFSIVFFLLSAVNGGCKVYSFLFFIIQEITSSISCVKLLLKLFFSNTTNYYDLVKSSKMAHEFFHVFSKVLKLWNKRPSTSTVAVKIIN